MIHGKSLESFPFLNELIQNDSLAKKKCWGRIAIEVQCFWSVLAIVEGQ